MEGDGCKAAIFPPDTVIRSLRRRISVHAAFESIGDKYRSAGRLPLKSETTAVSFQLPAPGWFRLDAFRFISKNRITVIGRP